MCRKAAYEDRRARKPEAFQVRIVERKVVVSVETIRPIDDGHDIVECVGRVSESPRAVTNVLAVLRGRVRAGALRLDGKWAPALRAIAELSITVRDASGRDPWRRRH